jgi:ABC-type sugar transport system ATPase subunit
MGVTHNQEEAMALADLFVVMNSGVICQAGAPTTLFNHPTSAFVVEFVGGHTVKSRGAPDAPQGSFGVHLAAH